MIRQVFIVGSPRSGTSILCEAMRNGAGYKGFNEGQVLDLLGTLLRTVDEHYLRLQSVLDNPAHMVSKVPRERIESVFIPPFRAILREQFGTEAWVDKTPGEQMIRAVPYLLKLWPNARVVCAKRRGIENVQSRLRKFSGVPFESHCRMWTQCMRALQGIRQAAGESLIEVDQRDIQISPAEVAATLAHALKLPPEQRQAVERVFSHSRPERTSTAASDEAPSLATVGWTQEQQAMFKRICGPMMQAFGYSTDSSYYAQSGSRRA